MKRLWLLLVAVFIACSVPTFAQAHGGGTWTSWARRPRSSDELVRTDLAATYWWRSDLGVTNTSGAASTWTDQIGSKAPTQGTAGKRPTIVSGQLNNRTALRFTATNSQDLALSAQNLFTTGAWTVAIVSQHATLVAGNLTRQVLVGNTDNNTGGWYFGSTDTSTLTQGMGAVAVGNDTYGLGTTVAEVAVWSYNGSGTLTVRINGVAKTVTGANVIHNITGTGALRFGSYDSSILYFDGSLYEVIMWNVAISANTTANLESYLRGLYGL